jgi:hypothetical protein
MRISTVVIANPPQAPPLNRHHAIAFRDPEAGSMENVGYNDFDDCRRCRVALHPRIELAKEEDVADLEISIVGANLEGLRTINDCPKLIGPSLELVNGEPPR